MLSLAGVWSWVFLGGKLYSLSWSPGFCAMIVIAWRITFPTRRNWFSWEIGNGKDQRLRAPHLSSLSYLKEGMWSWLWDILAFKVFLVCLDVMFDTWQGTCTGALHQALQTRVPSGKWVFPTLQLLRLGVGYSCQEGSSPSKLLKRSSCFLTYKMGVINICFVAFMSTWWNNANRILIACLATINGRFAVTLWNRYCQVIRREFSVSLFRSHGPVLYLLPRRLKEEEPWLDFFFF